MMIILNEHSTPQLNTIHHCRAEALLSALDSTSIDLIVTSPPYDNLRRYNGFSWNFPYIAQQSYRVLKPGGVLVWVVGDGFVDGSQSFTSLKQAIYFREEVGLRAHDTMIWRKIAPGLRGKRYTGAFEFMFIFSKSEPATFNPQLKKNNTAGRRGGGGDRHSGFKPNGGNVVKVWGLYENVWDIQGGNTGGDITGHPATFPERLVERHILTWSNPGDIVLDYFGGSGTTAKMARQNNRRWITCDISREYCDLMEKRLAQPYTLNMFSQEAS